MTGLQYIKPLIMQKITFDADIVRYPGHRE